MSVRERSCDRESKLLRDFYLCVCVFSKPPAIDLGYCINDYQVSELNLSLCGLTDEELRAIILHFGEPRTKVRLLNLSSNQITDQGIFLTTQHKK
jgi:hypothetical protein